MLLNFCQFDHPYKLLLLFGQRIQFAFQPREKCVLYAMPYVEKWAHSLPLTSFFIHRNLEENIAHSLYIFNDLCNLFCIIFTLCLILKSGSGHSRASLTGKCKFSLISTFAITSDK